MSFNHEQDRHEAIIHVLTRIAKGLEHMADAQTQALADLTAAVQNIADAIAGEIAALQAALSASSQPDDSGQIEAVVTNLNNLTASLKSSLPTPVVLPVPTPSTPAPSTPAPSGSAS